MRGEATIDAVSERQPTGNHTSHACGSVLSTADRLDADSPGMTGERDAPHEPSLPLVSVIIPTHNREAVIRRAVASVLAQTYPRIEIVVVDDRSTDGTQAVLEELQIPSIRILRTTNTRGAAAARNLGIAQSSGELIAFLDSDDAWDARKIELQVARFDRGPADLGVVYTGIRTHHPGGIITETRPEYRGRLLETLRWRNKVGGASSVVVKRAVLDEIGVFDTGLPACEDWDLWARIARKYLFDFVAEPCVHYNADGSDRLSRRSKSVFIANHLIFRRLNGRRAGARGLSMHLALQSRELYWLGRQRLAVKLAMRSLWLRPAQHERIALGTLKWILRDAVQDGRLGSIPIRVRRTNS
jgi:GT2 family glycosyltransferase